MPEFPYRHFYLLSHLFIIRHSDWLRVLARSLDPVIPPASAYISNTTVKTYFFLQFANCLLH
jgi:hypothetical protein